jgi:hypothetical protein
MSEVFTNRSGPGREKAASGKSAPHDPPRIRIDVPLGTSYQEIQESIFRQAYQLAGTQLRAAIALGITPDTVSRVLRRYDRKRITRPQIPQAWPAVAANRAIESAGHRAVDAENPTPDSATSAERENQSSEAPTSSTSGPQNIGPVSPSGDRQEPKTND